MTTDAYNTAVLEDEPVLYWKCNEASGTSLTDSSGNGNTGTITGNASLGYATDNLTGLLPNGIYQLDLNRTGTKNGYAYIDPVPAEWPTTAATFEIWYRDTKFPGSPGAGIFAYSTSSANIGNDLLVWWDTDHELQLHIAEASTGEGYVAGGTSIIASAYAPKHLVITWDGVAGVSKMYVNGNLVCTNTRAQYIDTLPGGGAFVVGHDQDDVLTVDSPWSAVVSNIAVYNTVLSTTRIKAHWDAYVAELAFPAYDATPELGGAGVADNEAPTVSNFTASPVARTASVSCRVYDNDLPNIDVDIYVEYATHSELAYTNGASTTNFSVLVSELTDGSGIDYLLYAVTPLNAGWDSAFTLQVTARDTVNVTREEQAYTLTTTEEYPPLMDPYT